MDNDKKGANKLSPKKILIIYSFVLLLLIIFLPYFEKFYNFLPFGIFKVNKENFDLNRLELLKIGLSLVSPILAYFAFLNTIFIQKENERKQNKLEKEQEEMKKQQILDKENAQKKEQLIQLNNEFYQLLNLFLKIQKNCLNYQQGSAKGFDLFNYIKGRMDQSKGYEDSIRQFTTTFNSFYSELGRYFKIVHRIIKTLNEYLDDNDHALDYKQYNKYIGILRTQFSDNEFITILFNSLYVKRGLGLGIQLIGTGFFGNNIDLKSNQHFVSPKWANDFLPLTYFCDENKKYRYELSEKLDSNFGNSEEFENLFDFIKTE